MASNNETGHIKNVANFGKLISFCTGYGSGYNPTKPSLLMSSITTMHTDAENFTNAVNTSLPAYNTAIAARENAFKPFGKLITRILNAFKTTDTTPETIEKGKSIVRKLQGRRVAAKLTDEQKKALAEQGKEAIEISSSQLCFDQRIDNFDKFVNLLASVPEYNPNEEDLKVTTLKTLLNDLKTKNKAAIDATTPLSNARLMRNEILYNKTDCLVDVALDVKTYVKSVYGALSPQYKQISGLEFKRYKV